MNIVKAIKRMMGSGDVLVGNEPEQTHYIGRLSDFVDVYVKCPSCLSCRCVEVDISTSSDLSDKVLCAPCRLDERDGHNE